MSNRKTTKITTERSVTVRLSNNSDGQESWLLADFPNEFEAGEAAAEALLEGRARFAFVRVTTALSLK